ncbi:DUF2474 domain-containing protein [Devosia submarina]|nr:DUF2474 domain-containing protein [Devosia submarina]
MSPTPAFQRLLWFIALWIGGVAVVILVGLVIRLFLAP